jgi:CubicO group peptidase (beta-lactamase class C family)
MPKVGRNGRNLYNNLMYYAAAYLAEKLAGQKWEALLCVKILI